MGPYPGRAAVARERRGIGGMGRVGDIRIGCRGMADWSAKPRLSKPESFALLLRDGSISVVGRATSWFRF